MATSDIDYPDNVSVLISPGQTVFAIAEAECDALTGADWRDLLRVEHEVEHRLERENLGSLKPTIRVMKAGTIVGISRPDPNGAMLPLPLTARDPLEPTTSYPPGGRRPMITVSTEEPEAVSELLQDLLGKRYSKFEWEIIVEGWPKGTQIPIFVHED